MDNTEFDSENPKAELAQLESGQHAQGLKANTKFLEAAALLTIWSLLIINQATVRMNILDPNAGLDRGGRPSVMVLFLGTVAELSFGLIGLFIGVIAFVFKSFNKEITKLAMLVQMALGLFSFLLWVFIWPSFTVSDMEGPTTPGLSLGQSKFAEVLGALSAFHFYLALQGGQFVFLARLVSSATGQDFLKQNSGNRINSIFWNVNIGLAGLWTLISGAISNSNIGGGKLDVVFSSGPNTGRLPGLTIFIGLAVIVFALLGIVVALWNYVPWIYYAVGAVIYLAGFLNFAVIQVSLLGSNPGVVSLYAGLVFVTVFLGPYFVYQNSNGNAASL